MRQCTLFMLQCTLFMLLCTLCMRDVWWCVHLRAQPPSLSMQGVWKSTTAVSKAQNAVVLPTAVSRHLNRFQQQTPHRFQLQPPPSPPSD
jgi:hypothetical protein